MKKAGKTRRENLLKNVKKKKEKTNKKSWKTKRK